MDQDGARKSSWGIVPGIKPALAGMAGKKPISMSMRPLCLEKKNKMTQGPYHLISTGVLLILSYLVSL